MSIAPSPKPQPLSLIPFDNLYAPTIASWIPDDRQLAWLAPSTQPPLTAAKVVGWVRPHGRRLLGAIKSNPLPIAYGELNPMMKEPGHLWVGHVVIDPLYRHRGLGRHFVDAICQTGWHEMGADRISLIVFPDNLPAIRCYLRVGFCEIGEEHHAFGGHGPRRRLLRLEIKNPLV